MFIFIYLSCINTYFLYYLVFLYSIVLFMHAFSVRLKVKQVFVCPRFVQLFWFTYK